MSRKGHPKTARRQALRWRPRLCPLSKESREKRPGHDGRDHSQGSSPSHWGLRKKFCGPQGAHQTVLIPKENAKTSRRSVKDLEEVNIELVTHMDDVLGFALVPDKAGELFKEPKWPHRSFAGKTRGRRRFARIEPKGTGKPRITRIGDLISVPLVCFWFFPAFAHQPEACFYLC